LSVSTAKRKVKAAGPDLDAVLGSAESKEAKASKSKVPVLKVDGKTQATVTRLRRLKEEIESLQSEFDMLKGELVGVAAPLRAELCASGYVSSVRVPGTEGLSVSVSWSNAYSKIPLGSGPDIEGVVGEERFGDFFFTDMEIKVKDFSEESLTELVEAVGAERFARFFEVKRWLKPTERYTTEFFTAFTPEERERLAPVVRQYSPSVGTK
jgi:hypothetical protein